MFYEAKEIKELAKWLLKVGDGLVGEPNDGEVEFKLPEDMVIRHTGDPIDDIVKSTYPSFLQKIRAGEYFQDRAILAPMNEIVQ